MGLLSNLINKMTGKDSNDEKKKLRSQCELKVYISPENMRVLALDLMKTFKIGYKDIAYALYPFTFSEMKSDIFQPLKVMGQKGCDYQETLLIFIDETNHKRKIKIPLFVFGDQHTQQYKSELSNTKWMRDNKKVIRIIEKDN